MIDPSGRIWDAERTEEVKEETESERGKVTDKEKNIKKKIKTNTSKNRIICHLIKQ